MKGAVERPVPPGAALSSTYQTLPAVVIVTMAVSVCAPSLSVYVKVSLPVKPAGGR